MKKREEKIIHVVDEVVVDGRDVELAREVAMKRHQGDKRLEQTVRISLDETLTTDPDKE